MSSSKPVSLFALAAALMGVSLSACGPSVCQRAEASTKSLQARAVACPSVTITPKPAATCEPLAAKCTAADVKLLEQSFDCLDKIPACAAGKENDFFGAMLSCAGPTSGLSEACKPAAK